MIRKPKKQNTLADKIADILYTAPEAYDPEDDIHDETRAKVNEYEEDSDNVEELTSSFRKQNIDLLEDVDKRYVGKKGSRKSLQDSDEWITEDEGLSTDEGEALDGVPGTRQISSSEDDEESENESESEKDNQYESANEDEESEKQPKKEDFKHMSERNLPIQVRKGTNVRNQLNLWENLLEIRIQLQKCLVVSNKMPQHDVYNNFKSEVDFKSSLSKTKITISNVLEKFLSLQLLLLKQYSETKTLMKESKQVEQDEEILSDTDKEMESENEDSDTEDIPIKRRKLNDYEQVIRTRHEKYKDYRNTVIQKWNEKTRLTIGKNNTASNSVLQQIDFILQDKQKLIRRTQLKRSEYDIIGKPEQCHTNSDNRPLTEHDAEVFDDDDFYHQLLRELIEFKSAGVTDPIQMSRQWIMLQNFRSKMKKKVDTKASKGRKVRYAVHSKLVNFMAPIDNNLWTEESRNELYSSLFGSNNIGSKSKV